MAPHADLNVLKFLERRCRPGNNRTDYMESHVNSSYIRKSFFLNCKQRFYLDFRYLLMTHVNTFAQNLKRMLI